MGNRMCGIGTRMKMILNFLMHKITSIKLITINQKRLETKLKFKNIVSILVNYSKNQKYAQITKSIRIGKINDSLSGKSGIN